MAGPNSETRFPRVYPRERRCADGVVRLAAVAAPTHQLGREGSYGFARLFGQQMAGRV
jgi:hypothetical protein